MSNIKLSIIETPKGYPKDSMPKKGLLPPVKLTWVYLKTTIMNASEKLLASKWTETRFQSYLNATSISLSGIVNFIMQCNNIKALSNIDRLDDNKKVVNILEEGLVKHRENYQMWRGVPH